MANQALVVDDRVAQLPEFDRVIRLLPPCSTVDVREGVDALQELVNARLSTGCETFVVVNDASTLPYSFHDSSNCAVLPPGSRASRLPAVLARARSDCRLIGSAMSWRRLADLASSEMLNFLPQLAGKHRPGQSLCYTPVMCQSDLLLPRDQPVDALLHKATDGLEDVDSLGCALWDDHFSGIVRFAEQSSIPTVEPLSSVMRVATRTEMCCALAEASEQCKHELEVPTWRRVIAHEPSSMFNEVMNINMRAPFIVKPELACGAGWAHRMLLVLRPSLLMTSDFDGLGSSAIVQRFVNHSGMLHKAYKLGGGLVTVSKHSLPDIEEALEHWPSSAAVRFHSLKELNLPAQRLWPYNEQQNPLESHSSPQSSSSSDVEAPAISAQSVSRAANAVEASVGMSIFGLDIVVERESGRQFAIDLNYFPSCKAASKQAGRDLCEYICTRVPPSTGVTSETVLNDCKCGKSGAYIGDAAVHEEELLPDGKALAGL